MRRLPNAWTVNDKQMQLKMLIAANSTVTEFSFIGVPYALSTKITYGWIAIIGLASKKKYSNVTSKNGFIVRFRLNSAIFSENVGFSWKHLIDCLVHAGQAVDSLA